MASVEPGDEVAAKNRRLALIVGMGFVLLLCFSVVSRYSTRQLDREDERVRATAAVAVISDTAVLDAAVGDGNEIADALGVAPERVTITMTGTTACVTVESTYLASRRSTSFTLSGGSLSATEDC